MNPISEVLATLIHYEVEVRDTLEYCIKKDTYETRLYDEKKRAVLIEVEQNTPLKDIINRSGENGAKLEKMIRDFYAEVYGDDSTILRKADDGLRVDHNQHIAVYNHVINVYEQVNAIVIGVLNDAKKNRQDVAQMESLWVANERLYRGVAMMCLANDLITQFDEFNKAMQEAKGQPNAASNFISQDIQTLIRLINTVKANGRVPQLDYKEGVEDKVSVLIENISGRRELKAGLKFPDVFRDVQKSCSDYIKSVEPVFRSVYVPAMQALIEQAKIDEEKRKQNAANGVAPQVAPTIQPASADADGEDAPIDLGKMA